MSLGNGKNMDLKLIKHDGTLRKLKEFWSAWTIEQHAYRAPYQCGQDLHRKSGPKNLVSEIAKSWS